MTLPHTNEPRAPVFPFLMGCDRSGTTLLRAALNAHPLIAVPSESHFIPRMLANRRDYERDEGFRSERFLDDLRSRSMYLYMGVPLEKLREALASVPPTNLPDAIRSLFRLHARLHGKRLYADKTPDYIRHIGPLSRAFPEARFIHIIRDGRDVSLSLREVEWGPNDIEGCARFWRKRVAKGRQAGKLLESSRYLEIKYEDFVQDPTGVLTKICGFIGVPYDPGMLAYPDQAGHLLAHVPRPNRHRGLLSLPRRGIRNWRQDMKKSDIYLFQLVAGDTLRDLGYESGLGYVSSYHKPIGYVRHVARRGSRFGSRLLAKFA